MATGFKVWTNNGSVLTIDESYENLSLYSSGTGQTSAADASSVYGLYTLTLTLPSAAIPQLALRTHDPSKYIGIVGASANGNIYSFLIRTQGGPVDFSWYIFTIPAYIAASTVGMKVWRPSDGRLVFDTGMSWMRVAGQLLGADASVQLPDPSRTYAVAFAAAAMNQVRQWQNQPETQPAVVAQTTNIIGARVLNGVLSSLSMRVDVTQSSPGTPADIGYISNGVAAYLALDITGY
jgi:hypothetical protein